MKPKMLVGFIKNGRAGGVDKYILECCDVVLDKYDVDILTNEYTQELKYSLAQNGVNLYCVEGLKKPFLQYKQIKKLIEKERYEVAYLNASTALMLPFAIAAWKCKVPVRVIHSHSSGVDIKNKWHRRLMIGLHYCSRIVLNAVSNRFFSCSELAATWMFSKKVITKQGGYTIIPNVIDLKKYEYNENQRIELRRKYDLNDEIVLGHVSNFQQVKNTPFLIDILDELNKEGMNVKLLLIGDGPDKSVLMNKAEQLGIKNKIIDVGYQKETVSFYNIMDFFLLPSLFEGFPIVSIEAQAAQVACVFSSAITEAVRMADKTVFLSIEKGAKVWTDYIMQNYLYERTDNKLSENINNYDKSVLKRILLEQVKR